MLIPPNKHFNLIYSGSAEKGSPLNIRHGLIPNVTLGILNSSIGLNSSMANSNMSITFPSKSRPITKALARFLELEPNMNNE